LSAATISHSAVETPANFSLGMTIRNTRLNALFLLLAAGGYIRNWQRGA
jgi:hypothetical protein